jgi:P-type Cu2+ transporter
MTGTSTAVIEVSGVHWASSKAVTESVLSRRPGVLTVDANPVSQTATVNYDPDRTSVAALRGWVRDCGYHCAGRSVPDHLCDPMAEPGTVTGAPAVTHDLRTAPDTGQVGQHNGMTGSGCPAPADHTHDPAHGEVTRTPQAAMGHGAHHDGGQHGGMSMDAMVADMRNRFWVVAVLSVPVLLFSPIGGRGGERSPGDRR